MRLRTIAAVFAAALTGACRPVVIEPLAAPQLLSPPAGAEFHQYPRHLTMEWTPVAGATRYGVEIDYFSRPDGWVGDRRPDGTYKARDLRYPTYSMDFVGDQPGRWRAWGVDAQGRDGPKSAWREFSFDTRPAR